MFIVQGKRKIRVKICTDHNHACPHCNNFDLTVGVFAEYHHGFFIPFWPTGDKPIKAYCNVCGEPIRSESLQKEYASKTRAPFYLYSGVILIACFFLAIFLVVRNDDKEKVAAIAHPQVGDVYLLKEDSTAAAYYFFVRVTRMDGDSLSAYHSHFQYSSAVTRFSASDYFDTTEEMHLNQAQLKKLLDRNIIYAVHRSYGNEEGFNRIH